MLRAAGGGQLHGDDEVSGVARGGEGALPLAGLVERADVQLLSLILAPLFSCTETSGRLRGNPNLFTSL